MLFLCLIADKRCFFTAMMNFSLLHVSPMQQHAWCDAYHPLWAHDDVPEVDRWALTDNCRRWPHYEHSRRPHAIKALSLRQPSWTSRRQRSAIRYAP